MNSFERAPLIRTIYKYPLKAGAFVLELPEGAHVLSVQAQNGEPMLWALVDKNAKTTKRYFATVGTGHDFDAAGATHLGTFQLHGGALVFHLFEYDRWVTERSDG